MIDIDLIIQAGPFRLDATFCAPSTGITCIWGASGTGKTSLLRAVAGLDRRTGRVSFNNQIWQRDRVFVPTHRRQIGYVFQEAALLPHLNVAGNLNYARDRHPGGRPMDLVVDRLKIGALLSKSVSHLSGGERQRVAIARTLLASPQLILMDEPLSSLDTAAKAELLPLIAGLSHDENIPILYVSHDWCEITKLANRVLHVKDGSAVLTSLQSLSPSLDGLLPLQINALARAALSAGLSPLPV